MVTCSLGFERIRAQMHRAPFRGISKDPHIMRVGMPVWTSTTPYPKCPLAVFLAGQARPSDAPYSIPDCADPSAEGEHAAAAVRTLTFAQFQAPIGTLQI